MLNIVSHLIERDFGILIVNKSVTRPHLFLIERRYIRSMSKKAINKALQRKYKDDVGVMNGKFIHGW